MQFSWLPKLTSSSVTTYFDNDHELQKDYRIDALRFRCLANRLPGYTDGRPLFSHEINLFVSNISHVNCVAFFSANQDRSHFSKIDLNPYQMTKLQILKAKSFK